MKALLLSIALAGAVWPAVAGETCDVPVADWQTRETLQTQLEAKGLKVRSITAQDGCYEAVAIDASGQPIAITFNPATLTEVGVQRPAPEWLARGHDRT